MPKAHHYFVYILASRSRTLYIGVTNSLLRRLDEHHQHLGNAFTKRYGIERLVYFETFRYVNNAIAREKYLKHFTRAEKLALVADSNPTWMDLSLPDTPINWRPTLDNRFQMKSRPIRWKADPPAARKDDKG